MEEIIEKDRALLYLGPAKLYKVLKSKGVDDGLTLKKVKNYLKKNSEYAVYQKKLETLPRSVPRRFTYSGNHPNQYWNMDTMFPTSSGWRGRLKLTIGTQILQSHNIIVINHIFLVVVDGVSKYVWASSFGKLSSVNALKTLQTAIENNLNRKPRYILTDRGNNNT